MSHLFTRPQVDLEIRHLLHDLSCLRKGLPPHDLIVEKSPLSDF